MKLRQRKVIWYYYYYYYYICKQFGQYNKYTIGRDTKKLGFDNNRKQGIFLSFTGPSKILGPTHIPV